MPGNSRFMIAAPCHLTLRSRASAAKVSDLDTILIERDVVAVVSNVGSVPKAIPPSHRGFSPKAVAAAMDRETNLRNSLRATACLLHWKRTGNLLKVIHSLLRLRLFDEVVVWNNNKNVTITVAALRQGGIKPEVKLIVVNSADNLRDMAKYRACERATNPVCYYQDDDWVTASYAPSLYAAFLMEPGLLHTATEPFTFYTNLKWSYANVSHNLHAGFTWICGGGFFLRRAATRFRVLAERHLSARFQAVADIFFGIWWNQPPRQLSVQLRPLPDYGTTFSAERGFQQLQYDAQVQAPRLLVMALQNPEEGGWSWEPPSSIQQLARAACVHNGRGQGCSLVSNLDAFPMAAQRFDPTVVDDYSVRTRLFLPRDEAAPFVAHPYNYAVDGRMDTLWHHTAGGLPSDAFFGLDLLKVRCGATVRVLCNLGWDVVQVSLDAKEWIQLEKGQIVTRDPPPGLPTDGVEIVVTGGHLPPGLECFRYIRLMPGPSRDPRAGLWVAEIGYAPGP